MFSLSNEGFASLSNLVVVRARMKDLTLNLRAFKFPRTFPGAVSGNLSIQVILERDGKETYYYDEADLDITHFPGNVSVRLKDVVRTDLITCNGYFKKNGERISQTLPKGTPIVNPWKHTFERFNANKMEPLINVHKYAFNAPDIFLRVIKIWH